MSQTINNNPFSLDVRSREPVLGNLPTPTAYNGIVPSFGALSRISTAIPLFTRKAIVARARQVAALRGLPDGLVSVADTLLDFAITRLAKSSNRFDVLLASNEVYNVLGWVPRTLPARLVHSVFVRPLIVRGTRALGRKVARFVKPFVVRTYQDYRIRKEQRRLRRLAAVEGCDDAMLRYMELLERMHSSRRRKDDQVVRDIRRFPASHVIDLDVASGEVWNAPPRLSPEFAAPRRGEISALVADPNIVPAGGGGFPLNLYTHLDRHGTPGLGPITYWVPNDPTEVVVRRKHVSELVNFSSTSTVREHAVNLAAILVDVRYLISAKKQATFSDHSMIPFRRALEGGMSPSTNEWLDAIESIQEIQAIQLIGEYATQRKVPFWVACILTSLTKFDNSPLLRQACEFIAGFECQALKRVTSRAVDLLLNTTFEAEHVLTHDNRIGSFQIACDGEKAISSILSTAEDVDIDFEKLFNDNTITPAGKGNQTSTVHKQDPSKIKGHPVHSWNMIVALRRRIEELTKKLDEKRKLDRGSKMTPSGVNPLLVAGSAVLGAEVFRRLTGWVKKVGSVTDDACVVLSIIKRFFRHADKVMGGLMFSNKLPARVLRSFTLVILAAFVATTTVRLSRKVLHAIFAMFGVSEIIDDMPKITPAGPAGVTTVGVLGALAMWVFSGAGCIKSFTKDFSTWMRSFADISRGTSVVKGAVAYAEEIIVGFTSWITSKTPWGTPRWLARFHAHKYGPYVQARVFDEKLKTIKVKFITGEVVASPLLAAELRLLVKDVRDLWVRSVDDEKFRKTVTVLLQEAMTFADSLNVALVGQSSAPEAQGVLLQGLPGVGKSTMIELIAHKVYARLRPHLYDKVRHNIRSEVFARTPDSQYYEGYHGEMIIVCDDLGQARVITGQEGDQYNEIVRLINSFHAPLNMANVAAKGKVPFTSEIVIATTNVVTFEAAATMSDPGALSRRLGNPIKVVLKPAWATPDGKLDYGRFVSHMEKNNGSPPDAWEFHVGNWERFTLKWETGVVKINFDQLIDRIVNTYTEKRANHFRYQQALASINVAAELALVGEEVVSPSLVPAGGMGSKPTYDEDISPCGPVELNPRSCDLYARCGVVGATSSLRGYFDSPGFLAAMSGLSVDDFALVTEAMQILGDPARRVDYDRYVEQSNRSGVALPFKERPEGRFAHFLRRFHHEGGFKRVVSWSVVGCLGVAAALASGMLIQAVVACIGWLRDSFTGHVVTAGPGDVIPSTQPFNEVHNKLRENQYFIQFSGGGEDVCQGTVIMLGGRLVLANQHFVSYLRVSDKKLVYFKGVANGAEFSFSAEDAIAFMSKKRDIGGDLCVFKLPPGRSFARIVHLFADVKDTFSPALLNDLRFIHEEEKGTERWVSNARREPNSMVAVTGEAKPREFTDLVSIEEFPQGWCGSLLQISGGPLAGHVLGIAVATSPYYKAGYCQVVRRDQIEVAFNSFDDSEPHVVFDRLIPAGGIRLPDVVGMEEMGYMCPASPVPMKTKIVPSALPLYKGQSGKIPSKLHRFKHDGVSIDPYQVALGTYGGPARYPKQALIDKATSLLFKDLVSECPIPCNKPVLSFDEAVAGMDYMSDFDGVDLTTSAGYPWATSAKGKTVYVNGSKRSDMQAAVDLRIENARGGKRTPTFYSTFLKSELRSKTKALAGRSRIISGSPMDYVVAFKMYFGGFNTWLTRGRIRNGLTVGINPHGPEWSRLVDTLGGLDAKVIAGDFTAFDSHQVATLVGVYTRLANAWYADVEGNKIRDVLMDEALDPYFIFSNTVYKWNRGLPSGHPATSYINCLTNLTLWYMMVLEAFPLEKDIRKFIRPIVYGDDNVVAVAPRYQGLFTQQTVACAMACFGFVYTTEDKVETDVPLRPLSEVAFLKRGFKIGIDGLVVAPLALESIYDMVRWVKDPSAVHERTVQNVNVALWELAAHTPEVWERDAVPLLHDLEYVLREIPEATTQLEWLKKSRARPDNWFGQI